MTATVKVLPMEEYGVHREHYMPFSLPMEDKSRHREHSGVRAMEPMLLISSVLHNPTSFKKRREDWYNVLIM